MPSFSRLVCDDGFEESAEKDAEADGVVRSDFALVLDMIGRSERLGRDLFIQLIYSVSNSLFVSLF